MVVVDYDSDTILEQTLTPRMETDILHAITKLYKHLVDRGLQTHLYMLDNDLSALTKDFIRKAGATHQLVPQTYTKP